MPNRALITLGLSTLGLGLAMSSAVAVATGPTPQVTARAGYYSGHEADRPSPLPVTFTVSKNHNRVVDFSAQAQTKAGCTNHLTGFEAPTGPMRIGRGGRFAQSSTTYPQRGVRVTVTGRFTSPRTVTGHISIRFRQVKGCDASRAFTAQRTAATAPSSEASR